jgi:sugar O-acyltransferase (sialic acid O-acetyltransferase NeuD family)
VIGLFGSGGHGREVMPILQHRYKLDPSGLRFIETEPILTEVNGVSVISESDFVLTESVLKRFNISVADPKSREAIFLRLVSDKLEIESIVAQSSQVHSFDSIGPGIIASANSIISPNVKMGMFCHINSFSFIAHDCILGDFVTVSPGVMCNGNVTIEDRVFIGSGALIKNGSRHNRITIGRDSIIGMGAVVLNDVPPNSLVVGNPGRIIKNLIPG